MRALRVLLSLCVAALLASGAFAAETVLIDEDFAADPSADWQLNGPAAWDSANERVVLTQPVGGLQSSICYKQLLDINNFKLEAKVKLCCKDAITPNGNAPADGMAITFFESADAAADCTKIGNAGGGLCVANLTQGPQIVVEFDIWDNGTCCETCPSDPGRNNHIGVEYSATGFPGVECGLGGDCLPGSTGVSGCAGPNTLGLNLYEAAGSYTVDIEVIVQEPYVVVNVGSADRVPAVPMHRAILLQLTDYVPFTGLVAVTGSTGGAMAEQSIYGLKLTQLPGGLCLEAPGTVNRTLTSGKSVDIEWNTYSAYTAGEAVDVALELTTLRAAEGDCAVPTALKFTETVPAGWSVSNISDGGTFAAGKVTWNLAGGAIAVGKRLTYKATAPAGAVSVSTWSGLFEEPGTLLPQVVTIDGETLLYSAGESGFDAAGFIKRWLILGPFQQPLPPTGVYDNPGADTMARDFLTDGSVSELTYFPKAGDTIEPDYAGEAASLSLIATPLRADANPGGVPTWLAWNDVDDTIDFENVIFSDTTVDDINQAMAYAIVYANNTTGSAIFANIGCASDDSILVIVNGAIAWNHSIPRGDGGAGVVQDTFPVVINPGLNRIMVKTFEGGGGFVFRLRIQDAGGTPITSGIELSSDPPTGGCQTTPAVVTRTVTVQGTIMIEGVASSAYVDGTGLAVSLAVSDVRTAGACAAAAATTITEYLPAGWTATNISNGGTLSGNRIIWNLSAAQLAAMPTLSYTADGPVAANPMTLAGSVVESGNIVSFSVEGENSFPTDSPYSSTGFITTWSILGPYYSTAVADMSQPGVANMQQDWLTDGVVTEYDIDARPGEEVATDYSPGMAFSQGIRGGTAPGVNPNGVPMWVEWRDANEAVNFQSPTLYNAQDACMAYAVCYVEFPTAQQVYFACGSDDSIQILVDHEEVWVNSIPRGWGGGAPLDVSGAQFFGAGWHQIMVKVFEGGGDWNFGVRMQNVVGVPLTSFKIATRPATDCPPCSVVRTIALSGTGKVEGVDAPIYSEGETADVSLTLTAIREASGTCPAVRAVTITDTVPAGWTATNMSDGGTFAGGVVTWTLAPAAVTEGKALTYKVGGPVTVNVVMFGGQVAESQNPVTFPIEGQVQVVTSGNITANSAIVAWLLLGPYAQLFTPAAGPVSGPDLQRDFLTDGTTITEEDVMPKAGDTVNTAYNPGSAASDSLIAVTNPDINPNGVPTWFAWRDRNEMVDFGGSGAATTVFVDDVNDAMAYAVTYLCLDEARTIVVTGGSDDALQVLVDGTEVIFSPVLRGWGGFQDVSVALDLEAGVHRIMAKVFEAGGGWDFGVQLLEADAVTPLTGGFTVTLDPDGCGGTPPTQIYVKMGAVNAGPGVDIADAIALLGYLFAQKAAPLCAKAADANDDDALNIADAITILGYLFSGKPMFAPDHSEIKAANNTCKGYAANGNDGKPFFPAKIGALNACDTQCTP